MNKRELLQSVCNSNQQYSWSLRQADSFLNTLMDTIKKEVKKGNNVSLVGFGSFYKVKRKARTGVNPSTGQKIRIKAKTVPKFRPGQAFKDFL